MPRRERHPDERYFAALRVQDEPAHPLEAALWRLRHQGVGDEAILRVVDLYEDVFEREILQAWIIAGASDDALNKRLDISHTVLPYYRHLCCNTQVFRDKLELFRWVKNYQGTREGKLLLERAVHVDGLEAVAHLCGVATVLDAAHVNEQAMRETYFRGMGTLRSSQISSADAAAAHSQLKTAGAFAQATQRRGAPNLNEVLFKLKHREMTMQADEDIPRGEILN